MRPHLAESNGCLHARTRCYRHLNAGACSGIGGERAKGEAISQLLEAEEGDVVGRRVDHRRLQERGTM
jgi:hypothetical protein